MRLSLVINLEQGQVNKGAVAKPRKHQSCCLLSWSAESVILLYLHWDNSMIILLFHQMFALLSCG